MSGKQLDSIEVDLGEVIETKWYMVYTQASLKKGEQYKLRISAENCSSYPHLQLINSFCTSPENISDNLLIGYAYGKSTFSFQNKIHYFTTFKLSCFS